MTSTEETNGLNRMPNCLESTDPPTNDFVLTKSGEHIHLQNGFTEGQIKIDDISHSLAIQNRFVGHTIYPYSIAQHSVNCCRAAEAFHHEDDPEVLLSILMHDAVEAYVGDIARPTKYMFCADLRKIEGTLERQIYYKYGLPYHGVRFRKLLAEVDSRMCATESALLCKEKMPPHLTVYENAHLRLDLTEWSWVEAKHAFISLFTSLLHDIFKIECGANWTSPATRAALNGEPIVTISMHITQTGNKEATNV